MALLLRWRDWKNCRSPSLLIGFSSRIDTLNLSGVCPECKLIGCRSSGTYDVAATGTGVAAERMSTCAIGQRARTIVDGYRGNRRSPPISKGTVRSPGDKITVCDKTS